MVACLVLDVDVEVSLHGPHVLVAVAGGGQDLEADVAQCVQDHHRAEDDDGVGDVTPVYDPMLPWLSAFCAAKAEWEG